MPDLIQRNVEVAAGYDYDGAGYDYDGAGYDHHGPAGYHHHDGAGYYDDDGGVVVGAVGEGGGESSGGWER